MCTFCLTSLFIILFSLAVIYASNVNISNYNCCKSLINRPTAVILTNKLISVQYSCEKYSCHFKKYSYHFELYNIVYDRKIAHKMGYPNRGFLSSASEVIPEKYQLSSFSLAQGPNDNSMLVVLIGYS